MIDFPSIAPIPLNSKYLHTHHGVYKESGVIFPLRDSYGSNHGLVMVVALRSISSGVGNSV